MKDLNSVIFIENLPKLDLHGFDRYTAEVAINDFIKDNLKMKNEFVTIVHGVGSGIIKTTTQETLKKNKNVKDYKINNFNIGCTIAQINIPKKWIWQNHILYVIYTPEKAIKRSIRGYIWKIMTI